MSVLTTTPLRPVPSAAAGVTITTGGSWTYGAWVTVIATTAAPTAIAGVMLSGGSYSGIWWELEVGVGTAGAEVPIGTLRLWLHNSGGIGPFSVVLPVPLGGISAGVRVAVRARANSGLGAAPAVALTYYENLSSDQVTVSAQALSAAPLGSATATLTPSSTAWASSAWVELLASAATDLGLLGLSHGTWATGAEAGVEYDLATGAAGAETVITTLREAGGTGKLGYTWLPGLYPLPAGARLAVRVRKAGTTTATHPVAVLFYTNVSPPSAIDARLSQLVVETLSHAAPPVAPDSRLSQLVVETLTSTPIPVPRVSQLVAETLTGTPVPRVPGQVTQLLAEVFAPVPNAPVAATQVVAELLLALPPQPDAARVTQLLCELIVVPRVAVCLPNWPVDPVTDSQGCAPPFPVS